VARRYFSFGELADDAANQVAKSSREISYGKFTVARRYFSFGELADDGAS